MDSYNKDIAKNDDFWRFIRIDEYVLDKMAELGDILLCQSLKKFKIGKDRSIDKICIFIRLQSETVLNKTELFVLRVGNSLENGVIL